MNLDLTDKSLVSTQIVMRLFCSHNIGLTCLLFLMVILFILKNTLWEIFMILFCRNKAEKYKKLVRGSKEESILEGIFI